MARPPSGGIEDPSAGRGKWGDPAVPKRGWTCVDVDDLGQERQTCEMCEAVEIRYVHHMQHPRYPDVLQCGCICSGHMEGDPDRAVGRERRMRNAAGRRARFPDRQAWRLSQKGNPTIVLDHRLVTVFPKGAGFGAVIVDRSTQRRRFARRTYTSARAAKLAAFDVIQFEDEETD